MEEDASTKDEKKKTKRPSKSVNQLPLARIKRIIKTDPDVKLISNDAALLITRATELFIEFLTKQAYENTQAENRKVLHYKDLAKCVATVEVLDFVGDVIPSTQNQTNRHRF